MLVAACMAMTSTIFACDICGCGGGNFYLGLLPKFQHRFFGVRYQYMHTFTQLTSDPTQFSRNEYHTIEFWSGWNIGSKWQVLAFVPYHMNKQVDDDSAFTKNGLGDITLLANYQLLHTRKVHSNNTAVEHELWIGGGIKVPTGKFDANVNDPNITVADVNAQLGTGSTDFILNTMHNVSIGRFGVNTTANYKINTSRDGYRFGNKFTASSVAFYRLRWNGVAISPNAGISYENSAANTLHAQNVAFTGGYIASVVTGVEVAINRVAIGFSMQNPVAQDYAQNQTQLKWRGLVHLSLAL